MSHYVAFETGEGGRLLVEVDVSEVSAGIEKAGLAGRTTEAVATAAASFEEALQSAVTRTAAALDGALSSLPRAPNEVELTFALKATGEFGNFAIAKAAGEANFTVKLAWKA